MKGRFDISIGGLIGFGGVVFYAGWIASAGYFQIAAHWDKANTLQHIQSVDIPKLKSYAGCQKAKADAAENEAVKSLVGIDPDLTDIPNCPPPPKTTPPVPKQ